MNFARMFNKVLEHFKGDVDKTCLWFETSNGNFGGVSPMLVMTMGRANKVEAIIDALLKGY